MADMPVTETRETPSWREDILVAIIALVPISIGWIDRVFVHPRPFWIGFYDPETIHFYAGLQILRGHVPSNTDNPATPLQLASAAIEYLGGMSTLDFDHFRLPAYLLGGSFTVLGAVLFVRFVARDLPLPLKAASVWVYFLAPHALIYSAVWSPEILYFVAGSVAFAAIVWSWRDTIEGGARRPDLPFLAGLAIGFTISIKFVFLGWPLGYVASLFLGSAPPWSTRIRRAAIAIVGVVAGFVLFTLPVVSRYPAMFAWVSEIITKRGFYGHGGWGLPSATYMFDNLRDAIVSGKVFLGVFVISIAGLAVAIRRSRVPKDRDLALRVFIFVLVSSGLTWAMALKHFNLRYLLPAALAGALAFVVAGSALGRERRTPVWIVTAVMLLFITKVVRHDIRTQVETIREARERRAAVERFIANDAKGRGVAEPVVVYGDFPTPSFALRYFATRDDVEALDRVFPREGTWGTNIYGEIRLPGGVRLWDYFVVPTRLTDLYPSSFRWLDKNHTPLVDRTWIVRSAVDTTP